MTRREKRDGPEIDQDMDFQRTAWRVQRVAWAGFGVVWLLGLLGLFGSGPLADAEARAPAGALELRYDRFVRRADPNKLVTRIAAVPPDGRVQVWIDDAFLSEVTIESVSPSAAQVATGAGRRVFTFLVAEAGSPPEILWEIRPNSAGRLHGRLGIRGGAEVEFHQLVYP